MDLPLALGSRLLRGCADWKLYRAGSEVHCRRRGWHTGRGAGRAKGHDAGARCEVHLCPVYVPVGPRLDSAAGSAER